MQVITTFLYKTHMKQGMEELRVILKALKLYIVDRGTVTIPFVFQHTQSCLLQSESAYDFVEHPPVLNQRKSDFPHFSSYAVN